MPPPATPSPLEAHLGFWLRSVSNHVSGRFRRLLEERGVTVTEWVALRLLMDQPATTHASLIRALGMTKGAASKLVSRLEERGLVGRALAEGSARDQCLTLTDAGRRLVPKLARLADENDAHFFGHLEAKQRAQLQSLLQELVRKHRLHDLPLA